MNIYLSVLIPVLIYISTFQLLVIFNLASPFESLLFALLPAGIATYFIGRFALPEITEAKK